MTPETTQRFDLLPIRPELLQALKAIHYVEMSAIQSGSVPALLEGQDLLAQAETGSGKTAAFSIGVLHKLEVSRIETQALVICPTRELSDQVAAEIRRIASGLANTRVLTLCGGKSMHDQLNSLKRAPHIVVGTPGRLKKHLEKGTLNLANLDTLVLDEADRMLDMGFYDDIMSILDKTNATRQTLLFSATYPSEIANISQIIQNDPLEVRVERAHTPTQIEQVFIAVTEKEKVNTLFMALGKYQPDNAIIFCNRKSQVQSLCDTLIHRGVHARALHGDLDQRERDEALILFGNKSVSMLVATDVAARGLDVSALSAVINFDLTPDPETYIHRIGRTGRAGLKGLAVTFVQPDENHRLEGLEQFLKSGIELEKLGAADQKEGVRQAPETCTIHLSAGKKDKIRPGDIVGALTAGSELTSDDIGKITVQTKVSFVAVDFAKGPSALKILSEGRIKRQKVRARIIGQI